MKERRIDHLLELSKVSPLIELDKKYFKTYITDPPMTYSIIIMVVAHNCDWCPYALQELNIVAKAYRSYSYDSTTLFFGVTYIEDIPSVVKIVKIKQGRF